MKKNYMSNPSYNYDQVNRASLACGPMVKWAIAQVRRLKYALRSNSHAQIGTEQRKENTNINI